MMVAARPFVVTSVLRFSLAVALAIAGVACGSKGGGAPGRGGAGGAAGDAGTGGGAGAGMAGAGGTATGGNGNGGGGAAGTGGGVVITPRRCSGNVADGGMLSEGTMFVGSMARLPSSAVADATAIYWANQETVHRMTIADGRDEVLYQVPSTFGRSIQGMDIDSQYIYFFESGTEGKGLLRLPLAGGEAPTVLMAVRSVTDLVVSNGYIYFHSFERLGTISRVPVTGGTPVDLVRDIEPRGVLVAGGYVWFVNPDSSIAPIRLLRVPITAQAPAWDGGAPADAGTLPAGAEDVGPASVFGANPVSDGTNVYFGAEAAVMKVPIAGGAPVKIAEAPQSGGILASANFVRALLAVDGVLYWSEDDCFAALHKITPDGVAQASPVGPIAAAFLFANATHVFVANGYEFLRFAR
jgi:hypothetical protein